MKVGLILGPVSAHAAVLRAALDPASVLVLVNDSAARDALRAAGLTARTLTEQVPTDSPEDFHAYEVAHRSVVELERALDAVRYGALPLIGAIEAGLVTDLVFFHRAIAAVARAEAERWAEVVFALTHYNASYAGLARLFARLGQGGSGPLTVSADGLAPLAAPLVDDRTARQAAALPADYAASAVSRPAWLPAGTVRAVLYLLTNDADLYLKPVYPVIEEFRASATPFLALTEDRRVVANLAARGVAVTDVRTIAPADDDRDAVRRAHLGAAGALFRALHGASVEDVALGVLVTLQAHDAAVTSITDWLAKADALDAALRWAVPSSVFLMPDASASAVLVTAVARARGIPTVTTVAASVAGTFRALGTYRADLIASYGHECSEAFRTIGWDPSRIVLTGAPALDGARRRSRDADRATVARAAGVEAAVTLVAVLTSRTTPAEDDWIVALAAAAARHGWRILVKAHPQHGAAAYADVMRRASGLPLTLVESVDVATLVHAADVVVTDYSHAGREALAADRPLVAVNVTGVPYPNNRYDEEGVAVPARSVADVAEAVSRALSDGPVRAGLAAARSALVDRFNWRNDGRAARRVYELLLDPPPARSGGAT